MATLGTEIRKLQPVELCTLAQILNQSDSWKKLMAIVPKSDNENHYMFNNDHFTMIEQAIRQQQRSGAEIFMSEWSTLSKKRPTCRSMLDLLVKAQLFRAADYLAVDILKGDPPERPKFGPAAAIDVSEQALEELLRQQAADLETESDLPEGGSMSWSLHFGEKPPNVMAATDQPAGKAEVVYAERSDLMRFSGEERSDLMKFSVTREEDIGNLPQQISDMMKFSGGGAAGEAELEENYVLQEARSEDIPLCVRDNAFQASGLMSIATQDSETASSIESSDVSQSMMASEQMDLPSVSQNVIPVVVLEYNDKDTDKEDT